MIRTCTFVAVLALLTGAAFAHHGWGSYDAANPVTVAGPILTSKYENPHALVTVRDPEDGGHRQDHLRLRLSLDGRERRDAR
jgi:hypothetical protein